MRRNLVLAACSAAALAVVTGCFVNPETGRRQLTLYPDSVMTSLGASSYEDATSEFREITGTADARMVQDVSRRIVKASGTDIPESQWEFKLLDAPNTVNAFALPGGKIAVYSGLLKVTQNADALAAVVGHEVAHVTLDHGNERVSQNIVGKIGLTAATLAIDSWSEASPDTKANIAAGLGAGVQFGVLMPFSRQHETEADVIGLEYMVRAGFDPYAAPKLWERMGELSGGNSQPEFMSTHPSSERRAQRLRDEIPRVLEKVKGESNWQ